MAKHIHNPRPYIPPYPIPPGATIRRHLEALGMTQAELSNRMGRPEQMVSEIINARKQIEPDTAAQLERVFDVPAYFWLARQQSYQEELKREQAKRELERQAETLKRLPPYKQMVERGCLKDANGKAERVAQWLSFLRVASFEALEGYIRKSILKFHRSPAFDLPVEKLAVWLRIGEIELEKREYPEYDESRLRKTLPELRQLSQQGVDSIPLLTDRLADCGVPLLILEGFPGLPVYGALRWLKATPYIQLTVRRRRVDFLWFALFHEIGHLLLHRKRRIYLDVLHNDAADEDVEREANRFAEDHLIPPAKFASFTTAGDFRELAVNEFAWEVKVHPGIVIGRLQHEELIPFNRFNRLRPVVNV